MKTLDVFNHVGKGNRLSVYNFVLLNHETKEARATNGYNLIISKDDYKEIMKNLDKFYTLDVQNCTFVCKKTKDNEIRIARKEELTRASGEAFFPDFEDFLKHFTFKKVENINEIKDFANKLTKEEIKENEEIRNVWVNDSFNDFQKIHSAVYSHNRVFKLDKRLVKAIKDAESIYISRNENLLKIEGKNTTAFSPLTELTNRVITEANVVLKY